ncbi:MAG TPA: YqgE/AlgH family protein [Acidimicrobiales bacterium]|nr:YqgE/AlgH family protein [Acidimicrobiales bacterium]
MAEAEPSLRGRLLVASPQLTEATFEHTVVLMLEHTDTGAVGVVLNRPSTLEVADTVGGWHRLAADPAVVFVGGPVSPRSAIGLAHVGGTVGGDDEWTPVDGRLGTVDLGRPPEALATPIDWVRIFSGYSGWGAGQLENELRMGGWIVADAEEDDACTPTPHDLWRTVIRRQPGLTPALANFPDEPRSN